MTEWTVQEIEARRNEPNSTREPLPGVEEISQDPDLFDDDGDGFRLLAATAEQGTVAAMLAQARALLGTTEHPPGSNHNFVTTWYGFDGSWCDMGISYEAGHSGNLAAVGGKFAYTPAHAAWFKAHGLWHSGISGIRAGDIVFFDWDNPGHPRFDGIEHVGIVEKRDGSRAVTIECNISDACRREVRDSTYIVGYGRPHYIGASQEDDVPEYVSLGMKKAQAVKAGQAAHAVFDVEYGDAGKAHADGSYPGIVSGGAKKTSFMLEADVTGEGSVRLVETDPKHDYKVTKTYPLKKIVSGEPIVWLGKIEPSQHLYLEFHPSADGTMNAAVKCHYWHL